MDSIAKFCNPPEWPEVKFVNASVERVRVAAEKGEWISFIARTIITEVVIVLATVVTLRNVVMGRGLFNGIRAEAYLIAIAVSFVFLVGIAATCNPKEEGDVVKALEMSFEPVRKELRSVKASLETEKQLRKDEGERYAAIEIDVGTRIDNLEGELRRLRPLIDENAELRGRVKELGSGLKVNPTEYARLMGLLRMGMQITVQELERLIITSACA